MASIAARDRLIVALDLPSVAEARAFVDRAGPAVTFYKIGLELVMTGGLELARELAGEGKQVFLDMKLLDIGNTVERATRNAAGTGATFLTVHGHDGKTLRAAVAGKAGTRLRSPGRDRADQPRCGRSCRTGARRRGGRPGRPPRQARARGGLRRRCRLGARGRAGPRRGGARHRHRHARHPAGRRRGRRPEAGCDSSDRHRLGRRLCRGRPAHHRGAGSAFRQRTTSCRRSRKRSPCARSVRPADRGWPLRTI